MPLDRRGSFFPGTEELAADEMRITALGTGRPQLRLAQANASWLVELGNGDKFMFDFGFGSQKNFAALEIPYNQMTAYFASHLHTDHVGDFAQLWIGSWTDGSLKPIHVLGPSGLKPEHGIRHFVDKHREAYAWDTDTRASILPAIGAEVQVTEFDYSKTQIVYDHNGVTVTAFPAVHIYDGPVSYRLDWNGRSFVYSGDTTPSSFMIEHAQGCEVLVHDTYNTPNQLMTRQGDSLRHATVVMGLIHTEPCDAGKIFAEIQPRLAVGFHFYNDFDTIEEMQSEIRKHYSGPLAMSQDFMVINVTADAVFQRMAVVNDRTWPKSRHVEGFETAPRRPRMHMSDWLKKAQLFPRF